MSGALNRVPIGSDLVTKTPSHHKYLFSFSQWVFHHWVFGWFPGFEPRNLPVNNLWFFFREAQADLGHNIGYRVALYTRWCGEILRSKKYFRFLDFWISFPDTGCLKTGSFHCFDHLVASRHPKTELKNKKLEITYRLEYFPTPTTYPYESWPNTGSQFGLRSSEKKSQVVNISDSKSQLSQDETVTHAVRFGISRNSSNFDRL